MKAGRVIPLPRTDAPSCAVCSADLPPAPPDPDSGWRSSGPSIVEEFPFGSLDSGWELTLILHGSQPQSRVIRVVMALAGTGPVFGPVRQLGICLLDEPRDWEGFNFRALRGSIEDPRQHSRGNEEPRIRIGSFAVFQRESGHIAIPVFPVAHIVKRWHKYEGLA